MPKSVWAALALFSFSLADFEYGVFVHFVRPHPQFMHFVIKILLSDLRIFGSENRAKITVLGSNLMEGPNWLL